MAPSRHYLFVFLEIFSIEGGIQSYVRDVLRSYSHLLDRDSAWPAATVVLLRDGIDCQNPLDGKETDTAFPQGDRLQFRYLKAGSVWQERWRMVKELFLQLRRRPERVFCGHINLAPLVRLLCVSSGTPYTVLTYGKEVWSPLSFWHRQALQGADRIWTIGRYTRDRTAAANHIDPERFDLLPCIVDGDRFTPAPKSPELLQQYGLAGAKVLMTVARLWRGDPYKGVDVTIRALPKILQAFPEVKYLVVGRGDDRPRLENLTRELGVADRVVFAGFVPGEALPDLYRLADAYVMPSQEGFGIVYLEAMACGVPTIAGDADGSVDPLQDGTTGWRVPHRDPEAVAAAVIELLAGGDRRCDGVWLRERAIACFGRDTLTQRLQRLLANAR